MAVTATATIAGPVNVDFQRMLLKTASPNCPYFAGSVPAVIAEHSGTFTAKWRRIENISPSTTALTEIAAETYPPRTGASLSVTDTTATVSKYGQVLFLTEEVDLINFNEQTADLILKLGKAAGRSLNQLQRNQVEDNGTFVYASGATADSGVGDPISVGLFRNVTNTLQRNDAMPFTAMTSGSGNEGTSPILPAYWAFMHPDVANDTSLLSGFVSIEKYAQQTTTVPGEFGMVSGAGVGVRCVMSSDASVDTDSGASAGSLRSTSGTSADLYSVVVIGEDYHGSVGLGTGHLKEIYRAGDQLPAVIMINKPFGSAGTADPLNEISTLSYKAWHASTILDSSWGRTIRVGANKLT